MGNKNYVVYHLHTEDSLLDSCTNYKLYVDKAVELGQKAIAFSEHGNIYNWIEKKMYCDEHNIKYTERHIVEVNPTYDELKEWYGKSGLPLKKFFNTSGLLYKEMQLKDKIPAMSEEEQLQLLATNGMLVKRPLVVNGDTVLVGFKEAEWTKKLN